MSVKELEIVVPFLTLGGPFPPLSTAVALEENYRGYEFKAKFDCLSDLTIDEPKPLRRGPGPDASCLLSAAVGDCLSFSLLFYLGRARIHVIDT